MEKLKIKEAIIVEGRYDKNTVSQVVDTVIIETSGFGIFSDRELLRLVKEIADKRGVIVFTDSDAAGFMIRGHIKGAVANEKIKHAYIPDIYGKEKRKRSASKEGKLGVEGMPPEIIREALLRSGATLAEDGGLPAAVSRSVSKMDFFCWGLSGGVESAKKRFALIKALGLPERLSTTALIDVINALYSREELEMRIKELFGE